jgi:hypothetical protein
VGCVSAFSDGATAADALPAIAKDTPATPHGKAMLERFRLEAFFSRAIGAPPVICEPVDSIAVGHPGPFLSYQKSRDPRNSRLIAACELDDLATSPLTLYDSRNGPQRYRPT